MKISAYCIITNPLKYQFPVIESIKSFLPIVDELIVVDGGSEDGSIEAIKNIGDNKIKIIQNENTKWGEEWIYGIMGRNWNIALENCSGDVAINFDVDYILHEQAYGKENPKLNLRKDCQQMIENKAFSIQFTRLNFILSDRYYLKSKKTLAINLGLCRESNILVKHGFDYKLRNYGFEPIAVEFEENGIYFGSLLRTVKSMISCATIFNYDYMFMTEIMAKQARNRHLIAEVRQNNLDYKKVKMEKYLYTPEYLQNNSDVAWLKYKSQCLANLKKKQIEIPLEKHPLIIREKIEQLQKEHQGYNCWNWSEIKSNYLISMQF